MIKWKFVIIRISLLLLFIVAVHFGTGPVLQWVLTSTSQLITGSKLEIADLKASPFQTHFSVGRVQLTDPGDHFRNVVDFENASFNLDEAALFRKKFIVVDGQLNGLKFGTQRSESGALTPTPDSDANPSNLGSEMLSGLGNSAVEGLTSLLTRRFDENFETVQFSQKALQYWPQEYSQLMQRGKALETRIREIRNITTAFKQNPLNTLRDLPRVEQAFRDAAAVRTEIGSLKTRLTQYRSEVIRDRNQILAAKERDLARIKEIKTDKRLNGKSITQLVIGDTQGKRVDQAIAWIKWMRKTFPHPKKSLYATRQRGVTIDFPGIKQEPDFLVRSLKLNGEGTVEGRPFQFLGVARGLTTQPARYGRPAEIELNSTDGVRFRLQGTIDRTKPVDFDRIVVHIPKMKVHRQGLELDDTLELDLGESELELIATIELQGDQISGRITGTQRHVSMRIQSELKQDFAQELTTMMNNDLELIRSFKVGATISGTIDDPHWKIESDVGDQVATALQSTLVRGYEQKKEQLLAKLNLESEKSIKKISDLLNSNEQIISNYLQTKTRDLLQLESRVGSLLKPSGLRFR